MNRHDPKSMSAELPWSVHEFVAFNRVQAALTWFSFGRRSKDLSI